MDTFRWEALKKEFAFLETSPIDAYFDDIKIKKMDTNVLNSTIGDIIPIDRSWNGAAGESYFLQERLAVVFSNSKFSFIRCEYSPIETVYYEKLNETADSGDLVAVVDVKKKGGFDVAQNQNEFGYGEVSLAIIYKTSKDTDIDALIKESIQKAKSEVKREADF